ncbi:MAG: hypothetical protein PHH82_01925 [Candidatus ainarchaeum sp.]|nr:hypothetical protein [Candidatus ainarchaeum sp.]
MKASLTILVVLVVLVVVGVILGVTLSKDSTTKDTSDTLSGQAEYDETEALSTVDDVLISADANDTVELGELIE